MEEFKSFALRGNVMDMAIGVMIGGAFSGIVTSLTDNFIYPILYLLTGQASYTLEDAAGFAENYQGDTRRHWTLIRKSYLPYFNFKFYELTAFSYNDCRRTL